jgi:PAS domain S-box-containing protein
MAIRDEQAQLHEGRDAAFAQALGDPIRIAILRALTGTSEPLSLDALTTKIDCESAALRDHLTLLVGVGAIVRSGGADEVYRIAHTSLARTLRAMLATISSTPDGASAPPTLTATHAMGGALDIVLDQLPLGVALYDASGHQIRLNVSGERITRRHVISGETQGDRLNRFGMRQPDGTPMPIDALPSSRALRGEIVSDMECMIDGQHGHETWLRCSAAPLRDEDGAIQGAAVVFEDISGQLILSHEEARQRALAAAMIEHTFSGIAVFDASDAFHCVQYNDNFLRVLGPAYDKRASIVGLSLADLFEGETLARVRGIYEQVRATGEPYFVSEFFAEVPPEHGRRWYRLRLTPLRDEHGEISGLLAVTLDITELVNARETSRRHVKELEAIFEAMPEAVMLADNAGHFILSNSAAERILGHSVPSHAPKDRYAEIFHTFAPDGRRLEARELPLIRALQGETVVSEEMVYERLDGQRVDLLISSAPVGFDDSGQIAGAVAVFQDITQFKELERQRDDFLGIAAHELRTPLATILVTLQAFLRRLQNRPGDQAISAEALLSGMERMYRQAQRLNKLVSDLIDTTRIRTGTLIYDLEPCDLGAVVRDAVAGQTAANPGRTITLSVPKRPVLVMGDGFRLSQIVDNLVSNALKYSQDETPVIVTLNTQRGVARLRIADFGVGIPRENLEHLFDLYYRVPGIDVQSGTGVGLGLGLHITRGLIERHGGHIKVRSTPGKGSTFVVTLPLLEDNDTRQHHAYETQDVHNVHDMHDVHDVHDAHDA